MDMLNTSRKYGPLYVISGIILILPVLVLQVVGFFGLLASWLCIAILSCAKASHTNTTHSISTTVNVPGVGKVTISARTRRDKPMSGLYVVPVIACVSVLALIAAALLKLVALIVLLTVQVLMLASVPAVRRLLARQRADCPCESTLLSTKIATTVAD